MAQVQARNNEDVLLAVQIIKAAGYYDGIATSTIELVSGQPDQLLVTIDAMPGSRYVLATITVNGAAQPIKMRKFRSREEWATGRWSADQGADANVSWRLLENGHPVAELGDRTIALHETLQNADYNLPIDAGPNWHFGGIQNQGEPMFTVTHLARFPVQTG